MEHEETFLLIMWITLCHGVLNMQETKYGMQPIEEILRKFMKHGFEIMYIFYERLDAKVCSFNHAIMYILLYT